MNKLMDIACKNEHSDGLNEILKKYKLTYEEIYKTPEDIADFAIKIKKEKCQQLCVIPFCHTIEAEAMGGDINLGDDTAGSRSRSLLYKSLDDILNKTIDYNDDLRLGKMLKACSILKKRGETVVFTLSGPFSILSCLIDFSIIFKSWRNNYDSILNTFDHLSEELLKLADKICDFGADYISYADPIATPNILGPKYTKVMVDDFAFKFVINLQRICRNKADIFICPVTAGVLRSMNLVSVKYDEMGSKDGLIIPHCVKENTISRTVFYLQS